jgi:hypothetical protein
MLPEEEKQKIRRIYTNNGKQKVNNIISEIINNEKVYFDS